MGELDKDAKGHLRTVRLNVWETNFLGYLAERAGECTFDYRNVNPSVKEAVKALITKGLISETVHEANVFRLRLTDQGRAVVSYVESLRVGRGTT